MPFNGAPAELPAHTTADRIRGSAAAAAAATGIDRIATAAANLRLDLHRELLCSLSLRNSLQQAGQLQIDHAGEGAERNAVIKREALTEKFRSTRHREPWS